MAQKQKTAHFIAEIVSLIAAIILLWLAARQPHPTQTIMTVIALGIIGIDAFVVFSWRKPQRSASMTVFHIVTESMGAVAGLVLMALACGLPAGWVGAYIFGMGLVMSIVDVYFITTWFPLNRFLKPYRLQRLTNRLPGWLPALGKNSSQV